MFFSLFSTSFLHRSSSISHYLCFIHSSRSSLLVFCPYMCRIATSCFQSSPLITFISFHTSLFSLITLATSSVHHVQVLLFETAPPLPDVLPNSYFADPVNGHLNNVHSFFFHHSIVGPSFPYYNATLTPLTLAVSP